MDPATMFLLAMKAAGAAVSIWDFEEQKKMARLGYDVEHAGIEANMEMAKTEAAQGSLESMQNLRRAMGTQMAAQAARGTATNIGSAFFVNQENMQKFTADEKARQLNLAARKAEITASGAMSSLHYAQTQQQAATRFATKMLDLVNTMQPPGQSTAGTYQTGQGMAPYRPTTMGGRPPMKASYGLREARF